VVDVRDDGYIAKVFSFQLRFPVSNKKTSTAEVKVRIRILT